MPILALVRDLMFASKITATARASGVDVKIIRDPAQLPNEGERLFVDLNQPNTLEAAVKWKSATGGNVIGFSSHTDTDAILRAKEAGIDKILTRGQFDATLPTLFRS